MHIKVRIAIQLRLGPLLTSSNLSAELEGTLTPSSPRLSEGHRRASPSAQRAGAASKRHARQWSPSVSAADTTIEVLQIQGFKSYRDETVVDPFSSVGTHGHKCTVAEPLKLTLGRLLPTGPDSTSWSDVTGPANPTSSRRSDSSSPMHTRPYPAKSGKRSCTTAVEQEEERP
jgi:hypothetical protein